MWIAMIAPGEFRHFRVFQRSITIAIASDTLRKLEGMCIVEAVIASDMVRKLEGMGIVETVNST